MLSSLVVCLILDQILSSPEMYYIMNTKQLNKIVLNVMCCFLTVLEFAIYLIQ